MPLHFGGACASARKVKASRFAFASPRFWVCAGGGLLTPLSTRPHQVFPAGHRSFSLSPAYNPVDLHSTLQRAALKKRCARPIACRGRSAPRSGSGGADQQQVNGNRRLPGDIHQQQAAELVAVRVGHDRSGVMQPTGVDLHSSELERARARARGRRSTPEEGLRLRVCI
jgi:hypothetical protein